MVKTRFRVRNINSYSPALDTRESDEVFVLGGKNYLFDAKGPKSGFGTRLIAAGEVIDEKGGVSQSIDIGKKSFLFTRKGCYQLAEDGLSWTRLLDLTTRFPDPPNADDQKWTAAYLTKGVYFCHPLYGFYKLVSTHGVYSLDPRDQDDIPGLPFEPQAICETNGRLVVLGIKYVGWSSPESAEFWEPELGGAGNQLLSDRVPGRPMTIIGFQNGFIVWTDQGCMPAEFIGGDNVFRFDRQTTEQLPINAFAVESFPGGTQILCTKQGLYLVQNASEPTKLTPLFSEFLREILEHEPGLHVRLTYQTESDLLYVQLRDWTNHYVHTYVLAVALDKWGEFSDRHLGMIRYSPKRGAFGYVDDEGVAHRFVDDTFNREITPHAFVGLDASIEIGYLHPPELTQEVDTLQEMQELTIGGVPARPSWSQPAYINMGDVEWFLPVCATLDWQIDLASNDATINGVPASPAEMIVGLTLADMLDGFGVWIGTGMSYPNTMRLKVINGYWDMSGWTLDHWCSSPAYGIYPDDSKSPADWKFVDLGVDLFPACLTGQAATGTNISVNTTKMHRMQWYTFLDGGITRMGSLDAWTRAAGGPVPTYINQPPLSENTKCGFTIVQTWTNWDDGVSGGVSLALMDHNDAADLYGLKLNLLSNHQLQLVDKAGTVLMESIGFPPIETSTIKVGITCGKQIAATTWEWAISINGVPATVIQVNTDYLGRLATDMSEFRVDVGRYYLDTAMINAYLASINITAPIDSADLAALTNI